MMHNRNRHTGNIFAVFTAGELDAWMLIFWVRVFSHAAEKARYLFIEQNQPTTSAFPLWASFLWPCREHFPLFLPFPPGHFAAVTAVCSPPADSPTPAASFSLISLSFLSCELKTRRTTFLITCRGQKHGQEMDEAFCEDAKSRREWGLQTG